MNKYTWRIATINDWGFLVDFYEDVVDPDIGQLPFDQTLKIQFEKGKIDVNEAELAVGLFTQRLNNP